MVHVQSLNCMNNYTDLFIVHVMFTNSYHVVSTVVLDYNYFTKISYASTHCFPSTYPSQVLLALWNPLTTWQNCFTRYRQTADEC